MREIVLTGTSACLFWCALVLVLVATGSVAAGTCVAEDPLCGPRSLAAVCSRLGVQAEVEELARLSGYEAGKGTSLLGLQRAVEAKGLYAVAMKIGTEDLGRLTVPAVAHLWGSHFVAVDAGDADTLRVADAAGQALPIKRTEFAKMYSGFALLVAKDASLLPKPAPSGPDLRSDAYTWDFGILNEGEQAEHTFKCRNVGNEDLVISKVESSCGDCVIPLNGPQTIPPGGTGEIKARVNTANQRRGMAKELLVSSNDPISPVVHINVTGYVRPAQLLISPRSINLGQPRRSETVQSEVYVPSSEEDKIEIASVSSNSLYVATKLVLM